MYSQFMMHGQKNIKLALFCLDQCAWCTASAGLENGKFSWFYPCGCQEEMAKKPMIVTGTG